MTLNNNMLRECKMWPQLSSCCYHYNKMKYKNPNNKNPDPLMTNFENLDTEHGINLEFVLYQ